MKMGEIFLFATHLPIITPVWHAAPEAQEAPEAPAEAPVSEVWTKGWDGNLKMTRIHGTQIKQMLRCL